MLSGNQKLLTKTLTGLLYPVIPHYFIPFWLPFDAFYLKTLGVHLNAEWQSTRGITRVQHHWCQFLQYSTGGLHSGYAPPHFLFEEE